VIAKNKNRGRTAISKDGVGINRRAVLGASGAVLLAASVASGRSSGDAGLDDKRRPPNRDSGESRAIATYVTETRYDALPEFVRTISKRSILDAIGVSMAAAGLEPACDPFLQLAFDSGPGPSVVLGTGRRASMSAAALANGALAHALDYEDAHDPSFTHPNAATVAAAISVADARDGISGREFIVAVTVGCDLVARLSMAQGNVGQRPVAYYPPAIVGTFGATAAAARLLKLSAEQTLDAFSLALCANSASAQILFSPYSDIRAIRDGFCAQTGVQAALLAAAGTKGFDKPFEGEGGFYDMYSGGLCSPGRLTAQLGDRFAGEQVGFKAWPACRATHIYIQAILEGLRRGSINAPEIETMTAYVKSSDLIVCEPEAEKRRPRAAIDAKFSIYYTLAETLLRERIDLASFASEALSDPVTLQLADKIDYKVDEEKARPGDEGGGPLLSIRMKGGTEVQLGIDSLYGSPENPMSQQALVRKFIDCGLAAPAGYPERNLQAFAGTILALEDVPDVRAITQAL
jgi:2-methylcitrate dehydratase PrpD